MWGDQDSRQARNQSRAKARRRLPRWWRGRELGWLLNKAWGAFSKVSLLGINHFFFLREYSVLNKGEIQNRQVGASVWHVVQGPRTCFAKLGWALGAEKGLSCHCTEELFLRNQKLPCRRPRGRPEPGRPAGNRPPLKVRLLRGIVRTRVATCHPAPSQSVCP